MSDSILTKKQLLLDYDIRSEMKDKIFYLIKTNNGMDIKILYSFTNFLRMKKWTLVVDVLDRFNLALKDDTDLVSISISTQPVKVKKYKKPIVNKTPVFTHIHYNVNTNTVDFNNKKQNIRNILNDKGFLV